jgi:cytochrome P450
VIGAVAGLPLGDRLEDAIRFARFSVGSGLGAYPVEFRFYPRYRVSRWRMFRFFREMLAWHRKHPPGDRPADFVDRILEVRDERGAPLPDEDVIALAQLAYSNTLLYGAPAACFALYSLLSQPAARARCEVEIDAAFADGTPDYARLAACRYFQASLIESMRMHPIGLAAPRVAMKTFEFDGCTIEKGEPVLVGVSAAHYLPEVYPNPHTFDPERHLAPREEWKQPGAFAPFGLGMHSCLGARMVTGMLTIMVATILRHVRLELDPPGYTLKKRVNPFPEPTSDFVLRVLGPRV